MTLLAQRWDKVVDFGSPMTAWTPEMLAQHRENGMSQVFIGDVLTDVGQGAEEIISLRKQRDELLAALQQIEKLKRGKNVGLADDSSDCEPKQQRHLAGSLEMGQLLERGADKEAGDSEAEGVFLVDHFQGNDTQLVASMRDLVHLDSKGYLVPHGIGGHARLLISSSVIRIQAANKQLAEKAAEIERLKTMIVMRFDHDIPPTFEQGYKEHEVLEPVTADHCRWFVNGIERLRNELCASQAREAKLREALEKSRAVFDSYVKIHRDKTPPDGEKAARNAFYRGVCDDALAQPTDTSALEEVIAKAGEVMRERCCYAQYKMTERHPCSVAVEIRALPGVTLEDLQK